MPLRIEGKLKTWNADRGFGFIVPENGGQEIFIHVSDYPRSGGAPVEGERLSFEIALNREGKKKAVNVQRSGIKSQAAPRVPTGGAAHRSVPPSRSSPRRIGALPALLIVGAVLAYGVFTQQRHPEQSNTEPTLRQAISERQAPPEVQYACDGRQHCSQMRSCDEARFFLKHCPDTKMDGDNDGIPCEQQWC